MTKMSDMNDAAPADDDAHEADQAAEAGAAAVQHGLPAAWMPAT
mgnify:CR=1 FL=1